MEIFHLAQFNSIQLYLHSVCSNQVWLLDPACGHTSTFTAFAKPSSSSAAGSSRIPNTPWSEAGETAAPCQDQLRWGSWECIHALRGMTDHLWGSTQPQPCCNTRPLTGCTGPGLKSKNPCHSCCGGLHQRKDSTHVNPPVKKSDKVSEVSSGFSFTFPPEPQTVWFCSQWEENVKGWRVTGTRVRLEARHAGKGVGWLPFPKVRSQYQVETWTYCSYMSGSHSWGGRLSAFQQKSVCTVFGFVHTRSKTIWDIFKDSLWLLVLVWKILTFFFFPIKIKIKFLKALRRVVRICLW